MVKTSSNINYNFIYKGGKIFDDVNNEVIRLNTELEGLSFPFIFTKRIYSITIELLYNIVNHGLECDGVNNLDFKIEASKESIIIIASNHILNSETIKLRSVINDLNNKSFDELRKMKSHQIKNGGISEKGGAGLGLIDIRMKSQNPIALNLLMRNHEVDWVTFEVKLDLT